MKYSDPIFRRLSREASLRKGRMNEDRVMVAFENSMEPSPPRLRRIDPAPRDMDLKKGVDYVAETFDLGKLFLQVKSSQAFANRFRFKQSVGRYNQFIAVVVINEALDSHEKVCQAVIGALSKARKKLLVHRGQA